MKAAKVEKKSEKPEKPAKNTKTTIKPQEKVSVKIIKTEAKLATSKPKAAAPVKAQPMVKPMVGIMDYARMYMDVNLPESAISYVKSDQPVFITHYTLPEDTLKGVISELSPAISTETRTFKGKVMIQNNDLKLRPGMFVKADIVVDRADSAIIIPKDVVQSNRRRKFVFIVDKNTAILRNIKTGMEDENNIEVLEGLRENDNLVTKGFETLKENSKVKVQK